MRNARFSITISQSSSFPRSFPAQGQTAIPVLSWSGYPDKQHNIPQRILDNPDNSEIITMPKSAKELEDAIERVYLKRYHAPNLTRPLRQRNSHI